jgi:hypothetical protein
MMRSIQVFVFHFRIIFAPQHYLELKTRYIYILLRSDLFRIRSRGVRTKIVGTKVPFGHFSYSEQFRLEKKAFGDRQFGDRSFGDRAFGDLTVYHILTKKLLKLSLYIIDFVRTKGRQRFFNF